MNTAVLPHVVIIGGGFAGLSAARELAKAPVRVTLIDRSNHHVFQPLLYQVATAALAPSDITVPIRWRLRHNRRATVLLAEVTAIDAARRVVVIDNGDRELSYDFLIVATGARHAYFGKDEWERYAPGLKGIDVFEADFNALEAAKANLAENCPNVPARFFWSDLTSETPRDHYDLIVMNPPFHEGHAADHSLGAAMIRMAAKSLKSGGRLMLVANRGLPYEPVLKEAFKDSGETCRNARFKVLWGRR